MRKFLIMSFFLLITNGVFGQDTSLTDLDKLQENLQDVRSNITQSILLSGEDLEDSKVDEIVNKINNFKVASQLYKIDLSYNKLSLKSIEYCIPLLKQNPYLEIDFYGNKKIFNNTEDRKSELSRIQLFFDEMFRDRKVDKGILNRITLFTKLEAEELKNNSTELGVLTQLLQGF